MQEELLIKALLHLLDNEEGIAIKHDGKTHLVYHRNGAITIQPIKSEYEINDGDIISLFSTEEDAILAAALDLHSTGYVGQLIEDVA